MLAGLAWPLSAYTIRVVELLARIPGGVLVLGDMSLPTVVLLYAAILAPLLDRRVPALFKKLLRPG